MSAPLSSLDLISAFEAVMATGSLSGAARHMGRSQPTIRRQVAALERELDAVLFTRSENGLRPTDLARELMPKAQAVLSEAGALVRAASGTAGITGRVRITCSRVFAAWVVPEIVTHLLGRHPSLSVEIAARDGVENLVRGAADVAIRLAPPDQDAVVCRKVAPRAVGLFAADRAASVPPGGDTIAAHLAATPFVWEDRDGVLAAGVAALGLPPPARISVRTDDPSAQIAHIMAGAGAGICQIAVARRLGLRRLAPGWSLPLPVWIAIHEDQAKVPRVRAVFDALVDALWSGTDAAG
jgi:DNA-binding transcriptional LysR family regulator